MKNDAHFTARMPRDLRESWNKACEGAGQDAAAVARELYLAAIRYHGRNGNLYPPFELVPAARTPEERITYTITASNGVAIAGDNNGTVHVAPKKVRKHAHRYEPLVRDCDGRPLDGPNRVLTPPASRTPLVTSTQCPGPRTRSPGRARSPARVPAS